MRQWIGSALVQRRKGAKPYLNQHWIIVNWTIRNKLQWNFNQSTKRFIHKNAFENTVCGMAAILSWGDELMIGKFGENRAHYIPLNHEFTLRLLYCLPRTEFPYRIQYVISNMHIILLFNVLCGYDNSLWDYRKISNTRRTKSRNLNVSRLGLKLSLRNILKPRVKWRRKM